MRLAGRRFLWVVVPLLVALIGWGWWSAVTAQRATRLELEALRARKQQLEQTNRALQREVDALKNDPAERARAARKVLDAAAPGEILVIVPRPTPTRGAK